MADEITTTFETAVTQSLKGAKQATYHFNRAERESDSELVNSEGILSIAASMNSIAHSLILLRGGTSD